ncbi:MAG: response regulator [Coriobacteriia bacterium]|nr:response regulator [Coriobacteriia bacterium]
MSRILVVDDEPHIRRLVAFSLEKAGHEVFEAADGIVAIEAAATEQPDLILMDVMMPVMTGYEAVERLKAQEATRGIPVVMLSAKSQKTEVEAGIQCGAERYICKPFTPKELIEQVARLLDQG